jgi:hypothetical protein
MLNNKVIVVTDAAGLFGNTFSEALVGVGTGRSAGRRLGAEGGTP